MAQAKLKGRPKGTAKYRMMGCACNAARAGQGLSHQIWKPFAAVRPPVVTFLPHDGGGGAQSKRTMPAPRNWNITKQHRNKDGNYANNIRPRRRLLQRQGTKPEQADHEAANTTVHQQNQCSGHNVTINRPHASRPTPN